MSPKKQRGSGILTIQMREWDFDNSNVNGTLLFTDAGDNKVV